MQNQDKTGMTYCIWGVSLFEAEFSSVSHDQARLKRR